MSSNRSSQDPNSMQEMIPRTASIIDRSEGPRKRKRSFFSNLCASIGDMRFCKTMRKCSFKASNSNNGRQNSRPYDKTRPSSVNITPDPRPKDPAPGPKSQSLDFIHQSQRAALENNNNNYKTSSPMDTNWSSSGDNQSASGSNEEFIEYTFNRELWKVKNRYTNLKTLSAGAFGTVCSAVDNDTGAKVAIKRMNQPYKSDIHAKRALRELKLLKFCHHENLLDIIDAFTTATAPHLMIDLYLVSPLMETDLTVLIKQFAMSEQQRMSEDHINFFMYQIVRGLKYLHSANVVHRDLKPSNIAVNTDCYLKIIDYGLCRGVSSEMTGYVQTRWYRAPEVMIDWKHYDRSVDMWSLGCIMGEMLLGKPVFPGNDHVDLLRSHVFVCGTPCEETLSVYESAQAVSFIRDRLGNQPRQNFETYFNSSRSCGLLNKLLQMDPRNRLSAEEALEHPYFVQLHDPTDEVTAQREFDCSFEDKTSMQDLKEAIFAELHSSDTN